MIGQTLAHFEDAFGATLRVIVPAGEPGAFDEVLYQTEDRAEPSEVATTDRS